MFEDMAADIQAQRDIFLAAIPDSFGRDIAVSLFNPTRRALAALAEVDGTIHREMRAISEIQEAMQAIA